MCYVSRVTDSEAVAGLGLRRRYAPNGLQLLFLCKSYAALGWRANALFP
jgi:hypothetical protein